MARKTILRSTELSVVGVIFERKAPWDNGEGSPFIRPARGMTSLELRRRRAYDQLGNQEIAAHTGFARRKR